MRSDLIGDGGAFFVELNRGSATALKKDIDSGSTLSDLSRVKGVEVARQVIIGDVRALPFPESSVNLVFFSNVFGDPRFGRFVGKDNSIKNCSFDKDFRTVAEEINRVLKKGGKVVILETYTPETSEYDSLIRFFKAVGFKLVENYGGDDVKKIFQSGSIAQIAMEDNSLNTKKYALVFEKPKPNLILDGERL